MQILAMFMIIVSQTLQSFQCVCEEMWMRLQLSWLDLRAFEELSISLSVFCHSAMSCPGKLGAKEFMKNTIESVWCAWMHPYLILLFIAYISVSRSFTTWVVQLDVEAIAGLTNRWILSIGAVEPVGIHCLLQGAGFIVLVLGSAMYLRFIRFPCFKYGDEVSPEANCFDQRRIPLANDTWATRRVRRDVSSRSIIGKYQTGLTTDWYFCDFKQTAQPQILVSRLGKNNHRHNLDLHVSSSISWE
jgi:hypothetical protein